MTFDVVYYRADGARHIYRCCACAPAAAVRETLRVVPDAVSAYVPGVS